MTGAGGWDAAGEDLNRPELGPTTPNDRGTSGMGNILGCDKTLSW